MIKDGYTVLELVKAAKVSRQAYYKWLKRELTTKDIQRLGKNSQSKMKAGR